MAEDAETPQEQSKPATPTKLSPEEIERRRAEAEARRAARMAGTAAPQGTAPAATAAAAPPAAAPAQPVTRPAPAAKAAPAKPVPGFQPGSAAVPGMTRREFLYYIWGASMALLAAEGIGAILWYALPRFRAGEFGGTFPVDPAKIPPPDSPPVAFNEGKFWLVNIGPKAAQEAQSRGDAKQGQEQGVMAQYKVCTHLGCLYRWVDINNRYECPCHGSKFHLNGTWIEGPAPRNLDRFVVQAVDASGKVLAETPIGDPDAAGAGPIPGNPIQVPQGTTQLIVDTGKRVKGASHA